MGQIAKGGTIVNFGTFAGALCFLVGAYLLLPPYAPHPDLPKSLRN